MKILLWTGNHDVLGSAIKILTHGPATHAAFLREDGFTIHEAFWPKVRDRVALPADRKNARAFYLKGLTRKHHQEFEHLFDFNLNRNIRYSVWDLVRFAFNRPSRDEHHTFCSRYVLNCCHAIVPDELMPLVRLSGHDWACPSALWISPRLRETNW